MFHTLCSWIILPLVAIHLYRQMAADVEAMNKKIQLIANVPSLKFDHLHFQA